jgi:DNA-binding response OmpR family regulator
MNASATRRILMIDDDRKLAALVKDYLEPMGFQLDLRHDGATGLQQALAEKYDAIILDVMMPSWMASRCCVNYEKNPMSRCSCSPL